MKPDFEYKKDLILSKFPLLGVHLAGVKFKEMASCPTMATDGYQIYYSSKFLDSISEEDQCFCITHEVMHIAFNHIARLENKNPFVWNIATDAVINQMLQAEGWKIPEWAVNIPEAKDKSAVEMYDILKEKYDQEQEKFKEMQDQYNQNQQNMPNNQSQAQQGSSSQENQEQSNQGQDQNNQGQKGSDGQGNGQGSHNQEPNQPQMPDKQGNNQETQNQENDQGDQESLKQQSSSSNQNHQDDDQNGKTDNNEPNHWPNKTNNPASQNGSETQQEGSQNQQNQKNESGLKENESKNQKPSSYFDQFEGKNTHDHWEKSLQKQIEDRKNKQEDSIEEDGLDQKEKQSEKSKHKKDEASNSSLQESDKKGTASDSDKKEDENTSSSKKDQNIKKEEQSEAQQEPLKSTDNDLPYSKSADDQEVGSAAEGADEICSENEKNFLKQNKNIREERAKEIINRLNAKKTAYQKQCLAAQETQYEIGEGQEVCNWKFLLKKALLDEETRWSYRRSNRGNDYMARAEELDEETKSETEVLLDVSGSVTEPMLRGFLHQLRPLLKHTTFKVGCFDSEFYGFREIKKNSDIDSFRIISSGGWENFDNAVRQFSKKKEVNKIIFTDGGNPPGYMPRQDLKKMNVIWIVFYNRNFNPCCGKVIHIEFDELFKKRMNFLKMKQDCSRQRD